MLPPPHKESPSTTLPPVVTQALSSIAGERGLTPTQEQRLLEVAQRLSNHQIAEEHGISVNTVKTEIRLLLGALGNLSCRHQVEDAVNAARLRAEAGATEEEVRAFLLLRFE